MQMRKNLYIFKHFAKNKKLFFYQYLSFSVWFPLSLKHWSPLRYTHKVLIYKEHQSVCPRVGIGTLPTPLLQASVSSPNSPPPRPKGGGHARLRLRGWGSPNPDDWRKGLALCLLCGYTLPHRKAVLVRHAWLLSVMKYNGWIQRIIYKQLYLTEARSWTVPAREAGTACPSKLPSH